MRAKLEHYHQFLSQTLDLPGIAWWIIDFEEDADSFYCNDTMARFFDLDPELEKHSIDTSCPIAGDYNKKIKEADQAIAQKIFADYQALLDGENDYYDNRFPYFIAEAHKTHYFNSRAKVLSKDEQGKVEIIYGIIEDITSEVEKTKALESLSERDPLTGLFNRLKLDKCLYQEVYRYKRHQTPVSILFLDIDNFKDINDVFGHPVGDHVLIEVAKILLDDTRKTDFVGRWGGEEFLIICPHTDLKQAEEVAEKIRDKIETADTFNIPSVTASIGITEFTAEDSLTGFINRADKALYKSKSQGKNQVSVG